jgi:hypothetical protein
MLQKQYEKQAFVFIALVQALVHCGDAIVLGNWDVGCLLCLQHFFFPMSPNKNPIKIFV